jgi:nucleoside phosphorylase/CheY-like chemotaxis protein
MIRVLIVDDAERKIERIRQVVREIEEIPEQSLFVSRCQADAKITLAREQFDLVILDIQLPNRKGESPQTEGGLNLLREIHTRTRYKKPSCIVGLTAYTELLMAAGEMFSGHLWSVLLYEDNSTGWEEALRDRLEYLVELKRCEELGFKFRRDLGVITALGTPEFDALLRLADWMQVDGLRDDSHYVSTMFSDGDKKLSAVAAYQPQMGMPAAAVLATKMVVHFAPRYLAMTGITAGVRGKVQLGDVIVADPCWDWGSGKLIPGIAGNVLEPDPLPHRLDSHLRCVFLDAQRDMDMLREVWVNWPSQKPEHPPTLHVGPCASGACVLANKDLVKEIEEHSRKLVGIDMEAYGLMHAAAHSALPHPLAFSIKGVSDFADEEKDDSCREYASYVSATLLRQIALKYFNWKE